MVGVRRSRGLVGRVSALLLTLAVAGCCRAPRASLAPAYEILNMESQRLAAQTVGPPVLIVADNQIHNIYSAPFLFRSAIGDSISSVAIRPPQLDVFGQDLLRLALQITLGPLPPDLDAATLEAARRSKPIIHLGDALDIACTGEWDLFVAIMRAAGRPWAMAPGNHDAFFYGNFDSNYDTWKDACSGAGLPMRKHMLLGRDLAEMARTRPTLAAQLAASPNRGTWSCTRTPGLANDCFLARMAWHIDPVRPWLSWLVQLVQMHEGVREDGAAAVLFDTVQYTERPDLVGLHAGTQGRIGPQQFAVVKGWLKETQGKDVVVLMGHHPVKDLTAGSKTSLDALVATGRVPFYFSAHTHRGQFFTRGGDGGGWLDINVGSIVDWHPEYRVLSFSRTRDGRLLAAANLTRLDRIFAGGLLGAVRPRCKAEWEAKDGEPDYYLSYQDLDGLAARVSPTATEQLVYRTLLAAYRRLFRCVRAPGDAGTCDTPSAEDEAIARALTQELSAQRDEVRRLRALEESRGVDARDYRLCQAYWASKAEKLGGRIPDVDDEYFVVPGAP